MSVHPHPTRPAVSQPKDWAEWNQERAQSKEGKFHQSMNYDPRFTGFTNFWTNVMQTVIAAGVVAMTALVISMKSDVSLLMQRPPAVSKEEFDRNANRWDQEIHDLQRDRDRK